MEAIILAGGQGKRLRPLTDKNPKCMIPVNGKPMLQYHIDHLRRFNIEKIIIACGYKWEKIKKHYGKSLTYVVENEPLGTSGAIKNSLDYVDGHEFFVVNADDITNINFNKLQSIGSNVTAVSLLKSPFGIVDVDDGRIKSFREKPLLPHFVNIGIHMLNKDVKYLDKGSLEFDILPKLAARDKLKAYKHNGYWVTINTTKDLEEAEKILKNI